MKSILKKLLAVAAFAAASACSAQITSTQVWNSQVSYTTGYSPAAAITSNDPAYSVYVKTGGSAPQESYYVYLQGSPDGGTTWTTLSTSKIFIAKTDTIGNVYQMNVDGKATKLRLQTWPASSNNAFPVTLSAWIVN